MDEGWIVMVGLGLLFAAGFLIALVKETWELVGWLHWVTFPFVSAVILALWFFGSILFIGGIVKS